MPMPAPGSRHARTAATERLAMAPVASIVAIAILVAACGGAAPTPAPTVAPTPVVTPDPHLGDPASAKDVFNGLGRAGLRLTPNTAAAGTGDDVVVTRINATYLGWPLDLFQFRTSADLAAATIGWETGEALGRDDPPVALTGVNILVTWGPRRSDGRPDAPDKRQAEALEALVDALEPLLSPLRARSVVPLELASAPATPATPAASTDPSVEPETTPVP